MVWRDRFRNWLSHSKEDLFSRRELEEILYEADLSAPLVEKLVQTAESAWATDRAGILTQLQGELIRILGELETPACRLPLPGAILLLGVNGVGKTTVAAKLAHRYKMKGNRVVLAAADTFRAGAIDQIKRWGERIGVEVVAQSSGADAAAVAFDAWQRAIAVKGIAIIDTAGRLHTQKPLVDELRKIVRVLAKDGQEAPHERYLVLDGTAGQNSLIQSEVFLKAVDVTGLIITKLDGTARGGAALSSAVQLRLPIRYMGTGEGIDDFESFDPGTFCRELLRL